MNLVIDSALNLVQSFILAIATYDEYFKEQFKSGIEVEVIVKDNDSRREFQLF